MPSTSEARRGGTSPSFMRRSSERSVLPSVRGSGSSVASDSASRRAMSALRSSACQSLPRRTNSSSSSTISSRTQPSSRTGGMSGDSTPPAYPRSVATTRGADLVGRVLGGRYRLLAPIGAGASAQVFLADDITLRRRVAVKLLHPALAGDEGFLRRFRSEAQVAAGLNHPNVMAVFACGEDNGTPFLIPEYPGGGRLRSMAGRRTPLA